MKHYLYALLFFMTAQLGALQTPLLFLLYDAGETIALAPVMISLDREGTDFRVLVMGAASEEIRRIPLFHSKVIDLNKNGSWQHDQKLTNQELNTIVEHLSADVVVTGVASVVQYQISKVLKSKGSEILAYYDNFIVPLNRHPHQDIIAPFVELADTFMVPSRAIADSIDETVAVVGQPSLQVWADRLATLDGTAVRRDYGYSHKPLLVYCGCDSENYADAFRLFVDCVKGNPNWQIAIQLHPNAEGAMEREVLAEAGLKSVRLYDRIPGMLPLVAAADIVVVHRAITGIQAGLAGKSVIQVDTVDSGFWYNLASDPTMFRFAVAQALHKPPTDPAKLYRKVGIPQDSKERILKMIAKHMPNSHQSVTSFFHSSGM